MANHQAISIDRFPFKYDFAVTPEVTTENSISKVNFLYSVSDSILDQLSWSSSPLTIALSGKPDEQLVTTLESVAKALAHIPPNLETNASDILILLFDPKSKDKHDDPLSLHCSYRTFTSGRTTLNLLFIESPLIRSVHDVISFSFSAFFTKIRPSANLSKTALLYFKTGMRIEEYFIQHALVALEGNLEAEVIVPRVVTGDSSFFSYNQYLSLNREKEQVFNSYYWNTFGRFNSVETDALLLRGSLLSYSQIKEYLDSKIIFILGKNGADKKTVMSNVLGLPFKLPKMVHDNGQSVVYAPNCILHSNPAYSIEDKFAEEEGEFVVSLALMFYNLALFKEFAVFSSKHSISTKLLYMVNLLVNLVLFVSKLLVPTIYIFAVWVIFKEAQVDNVFLGPYMVLIYAFFFLVGIALNSRQNILMFSAIGLGFMHFMLFFVFFKALYSIYDNYEETNNNQIFGLSSVIFILFVFPLLFTGKHGFAALLKGTMSYLLFAPVKDLIFPFRSIDSIKLSKIYPLEVLEQEDLEFGFNREAIEETENDVKNGVKLAYLAVNFVILFLMLFHTEESYERLNWVLAYVVISVCVLAYKNIVIVLGLLLYNDISKRSGELLNSFINTSERRSNLREKHAQSSRRELNPAERQSNGEKEEIKENSNELEENREQKREEEQKKENKKEETELKRENKEEKEIEGQTKEKEEENREAEEKEEHSGSKEENREEHTKKEDLPKDTPNKEEEHSLDKKEDLPKDTPNKEERPAKKTTRELMKERMEQKEKKKDTLSGYKRPVNSEQEPILEDNDFSEAEDSVIEEDSKGVDEGEVDLGID